MPAFTTRPEIRGTFGVVGSTHWLASAVAMATLEKGGNAFDAAAAAGLTLQVVEPPLNGPLGEVPNGRGAATGSGANAPRGGPRGAPIDAGWGEAWSPAAACAPQPSPAGSTAGGGCGATAAPCGAQTFWGRRFPMPRQDIRSPG